MSNKEKYKKFCEEEKIPIFSEYWWLDTVCGENGWGVVLAENKGKVVGSLPYYIKNRFFLRIISLPRLTQTMGVHIKYPDGQKYANKISYEKKIMEELISKLPKFHLFFQKFHYSVTNWMPFYWSGFSQSTRYSYVIEDLRNTDAIFDSLGEHIKRHIRKAQSRFKVVVGDDIEKVYEINSFAFERKNKKVPYSLDYVKKIDRSCKSRNARRILFAVDEQGRECACAYFVWNRYSMYYLMGSANDDGRVGGASSLLVWEGIKFASSVTEKFDFEGSMIKPVEKVFRFFGGVQKPYFNIYKVNFSFFGIKNLLKKIF